MPFQPKPAQRPPAAGQRWRRRPAASDDRALAYVGAEFLADHDIIEAAVETAERAGSGSRRQLAVDRAVPELAKDKRSMHARPRNPQSETNTF